MQTTVEIKTQETMSKTYDYNGFVLTETRKTGKPTEYQLAHERLIYENGPQTVSFMSLSDRLDIIRLHHLLDEYLVATESEDSDGG